MDYIPKEDLEGAIEDTERRLERNKEETKKLECELQVLNRALEEEDRKVPYRLWKCNFTECDHGVGLAGRDSCPGDPADKCCEEFAQEYSEE